MSEIVRTKWQAAVVAIAPLVLLAALGYHPYIGNLMDNREVAAAMSADVTRWGLAHLAVGIGFGMLLLAFLAVRSYLRDEGEDRWSALSVPFLVVGTTLYIFLPAMETAMAAAAQVGADPVALQEQLGPWFVPVMIAGALTFGAGTLLVARAVVTSGALSPELTRIVAGALVIVALSRFVPRGQALYVGAVAGVVALLPIAARIWSSAHRPSLSARTALAGRGGAH
jgi:hypothetical protein